MIAYSDEEYKEEFLSGTTNYKNNIVTGVTNYKNNVVIPYKEENNVSFVMDDVETVIKAEILKNKKKKQYIKVIISKPYNINKQYERNVGDIINVRGWPFRIKKISVDNKHIKITAKCKFAPSNTNDFIRSIIGKDISQ